MRTVFSIFANDIKSVSRRFFALAIVVAISALPALYAWVNIYANGNPYANTGGIRIALASNDPGIDLADGTHVNMAEEIFEDQKDSTKIGWQFPDSPEEAIAGVESGKYYAAIIFEKNFTYNIYHFEQALLDEEAPITYYENQKANAIASKITQTAAGNLQESIKTKYLETVFRYVFAETNDIADELSGNDSVEKVLDELENLRDTLREYEAIINSFTSKSASVHKGINSAKNKIASTRKSANKSAANAVSDLDTARRSLIVLQKALEEREQKIETKRKKLEETLKKLHGGDLTEEEIAKLQDQAKKRDERLKADLEGLLAVFPESDKNLHVQAIRGILTSMISDVDALESAIGDPESTMALLEELKSLSQVSLSKSVQALIDEMTTILDLMEPLMISMGSMLDGLGPVLSNADSTVSSLDASLLQMKSVFNGTADRIDEIIDKVNAADAGDKLDVLVELLGGDPEAYAKFFSALVDVNVEEVYSVASYGAAMAPFYSVLAIWVGGVILVSILKTHIDRNKFPNATEAEAFFGRWLLFILVGQAQAAIIVAGDIYLLGCAPVHPGLMYLAAAVTSLVFVTLIYALTISFGDVGKAIVVIVMVLQIAGSSGSYPIEILPVIFSKGYKFFPFPYAINAMREALCGTYQNDYATYLSLLMLFFVVALAIGLLVRKPFIGMNDFVSEKIEETEVL